MVLRGSGCDCPGPGRRIATKSAVVLSPACGNGVYGNFSEDTFPAVPAQEPAVISTCCASLKPCLSTLSWTTSHSYATIREEPENNCRGTAAGSQGGLRLFRHCRTFVYIRNLTACRSRPNVRSNLPLTICFPPMPLSALDVDAREHLRSELEALEGVRRAVIDEDPLRIYLICERAEGPTEMLVHSVLARSGLAASGAEVHL